MCDPISATISLLSHAIGMPASVSTFVDPINSARHIVGDTIGGSLGNFINFDKSVTKDVMRPDIPRQAGGVNLIDGGKPSAPVGPYQPVGNTYEQKRQRSPGFTAPALNTYAEGVSKTPAGQFSSVVDEEVQGPFNQGAAKNVKKVTM